MTFTKGKIYWLKEYCVLVQYMHADRSAAKTLQNKKWDDLWFLVLGLDENRDKSFEITLRRGQCLLKFLRQIIERSGVVEVDQGDLPTWLWLPLRLKEFDMTLSGRKA